jgi:hypothetical protein
MEEPGQDQSITWIPDTVKQMAITSFGAVRHVNGGIVEQSKRSALVYRNRTKIRDSTEQEARGLVPAQDDKKPCLVGNVWHEPTFAR